MTTSTQYNVLVAGTTALPQHSQQAGQHSMPSAYKPFGKLQKKAPLARTGAANARTFFDSADYALAKEGKRDAVDNNKVGTHMVYYTALLEQPGVGLVNTTPLKKTVQQWSTPGTQPLHKGGVHRASRLSECSMH